MTSSSFHLGSCAASDVNAKREIGPCPRKASLRDKFETGRTGQQKRIRLHRAGAAKLVVQFRQPPPVPF